MRPELYAVNEKNHLVRILGVGNQLRGFEGGHRFAGTGGMPDEAAHLAAVFPLVLCNRIGYFVGGVILIGAHDLQNAVCIVGHRIEADELMRHWDRQQRGGQYLPVVDPFIVEICPVEIEIRIETTVWAGVCKVHRFLRIHRNKDLHQ